MPTDYCTFHGVLCAGGEVVQLNLYQAGLRGSLPASLGRLSALEVAGLSRNQLSGTLPPSLGNLTRLRFLCAPPSPPPPPLPPGVARAVAQ